MGPLILPPALKRWGSPRRQGLCSHLADLWAPWNSAPRSKAVGTPRPQGLCSRLAHCWATTESAPRCEAVGTPRRQGLCSHLAHLWATSDFFPRSEALGTPQVAGVVWPPCPLVGHLRFCPPLCSGGDPPGDRGYVATLPTYGPLLILPPPRSEAVGTPQAAGVM